MIVLDTGILIAIWGHNDPHYASARAVLEANAAATMHPVNLGEALVHSVRRQDEAWARAQLASLDIRAAEPVPDEAFLLARARATTGLRMPDCCALVTAEHLGLPLATVDHRLAAAARERGVRVLPVS